MKATYFVDEVEVFLKAGRGGEGSSAKKRTKRGFVNWGGDGGKGADIYIKGSPHLFDLSKFLNKKVFLGACGENGSSNRRKGRDAPSLVIEVPLGTLIKDEQGKVLWEIKDCGKVLLAKGGRGGKGNFKRRKTLPPQSGETRKVVLDFRICADVVLLGESNCGKSTLISRLTNLKPRISEFPFTTQLPVWGIVERDYRVFTILELPAIIGGKEEKLLGLKFLKHAEKARVLIFLLDAERPPYEEKISSIKEVLNKHGIDYLSKKTLVVINKIDKINDKNLPQNYLKISAEKNIGIKELVEKIFSFLR
ncbi:MAG: 50S ribosome-binding GTPase [Candidatus Omnitrophica bacterium]|nr:50S ribosome-binding GTPase [Candidatus Omnitrophota bacterium]